jgi:hypothetical protein
MATVEQIPGLVNVVVCQGDTWAQSFLFKEDDVAVDASGWTVTSQVRATEDAATDTDLSVSMDDAGDGIITVTLSASACADLPQENVWDMQRTVAGVVRTLLAGKFTVKREVTR